MSRRSVFVTVGLFLLILCGVGGALGLLARYEPKAYLRASLPPGEKRKQLNKEFIDHATEVYNSIIGKTEMPYWHVAFTQDQVNGFLAEEFRTAGWDRLLPDCIQQPRVMLEPDRVRVAFRYGRGLWSTIVSVDVRVWVTRDEPNSVALQVIGFHAGALPLSAQAILEPVVEAGRQHGIDVAWYRHEGSPVALLRFQPTLALQAVRVADGAIALQGHFSENNDGPSLVQTQAASAAPGGN
jgi:hypothetical protein